MPRAFSRARVRQVRMLLGFSGLNVRYWLTRWAIPGLREVRRWKDRQQALPFLRLQGGRRSPTSISRLEFTSSSRATCSDRSTYLAIQYIASASRRASAARASTMAKRSPRSPMRNLKMDANAVSITFLLQNPGILAASALAAVNDEAALAQGHPRQAAGHDDDLLPVQNIWSKIDAPAFEVVLDKAGMLAELNHRLGDVISRIGRDFLGEAVALVLRRLVSHQHSVSAGFVGAFDDQLVQMFQHEFAVGIPRRKYKSEHWAKSLPDPDKT